MEPGGRCLQGDLHVDVRNRSKTRLSECVPIRCAKHRWGRLGQWNLAGQKVDLLDVAGRDLDIVFAQEIARDQSGWDSHNSEFFHWVSHRAPNHYRGVAIGVAGDKLDCIIQKIASGRGMWVLARIRGLGRVVLGTMHCHTGATNAIYQAAAHAFIRSCPRKWRHYPLLCGVDVNEDMTWFQQEETRAALASGSSNLNEVSQLFLEIGVGPVAPVHAQWGSPTFFPRDETRRGRHIDAVWMRRMSVEHVHIDGPRRHVVGTDHALLHADIYSLGKTINMWGNDSRPRYMCSDLPDHTIGGADDVAVMAKQCTCPRKSRAYHDSDEVKEKIRDARASNDSKAWKNVHKLRRREKREWERQRLSMILHGDWHEYRCLQRERKRHTGWWGRMLQNKTSSENTALVRKHLSSKLVNEYNTDWDELLQMQIDSVEIRGEFEEFVITDAREVLQGMKVNSAVGPDGISVSFLRHAMNDDKVGPQILSLVNHIVCTGESPVHWSVNFLALLAKCECPIRPSDLRPICVSSVFHKMVTKMVCLRTMPIMRTGSRISGCGKGRQAADVIGTVTRLRDVCQEWKVPLLLCKLDISGAFDKIDRQKIVEFLKDRLAAKDLDHELKYLLGQLKTYSLSGKVPGGHEIDVQANAGIKQGAPESAEIFGMIMDSLLSRLLSHPKWGEFGKPIPELDVQLIFYQDDIFVVETELGRLAKRIKVLERCLAQHGLQLAADKTKIVASESYRGPRRARVAETEFVVAGPSESVKVLGISFNLRDSPSQQARELLCRARVAAANHGPLLRGRACWQKKVDMIRTLVESQFSWTAGALHWSSAELKQANTLQLHVMRNAFRILRTARESWQEWNSRSMRMCRAWLAYNNWPRWSTSILRLQHTLRGHWARRVEILDTVRGDQCECLPMRALRWRSTAWWRWQQRLSPTVGARHPVRFYASNVERQLSDAHGVNWPDDAQDRCPWSRLRDDYLRKWDVKWTRERQLSVRY